MGVSSRWISSTGQASRGDGYPRPRNSRNSAIFPITAAVAVCSLVLLFAALTGGWFGPFARKGSIFCETMRAGLLKQPANTWSNLGFMMVGLMMAWRLSKSVPEVNCNPLTESPSPGMLLCVLTVLLGPGSMAMHASGTRLGAYIDNVSMDLMAAFLVSYAVRRLFMGGPMLFGFAFIALLAGQIALRHTAPRQGNIGFAAYCLATIAVEALIVRNRRSVRRQVGWGYASVALIAVAFLIWNLSLTGRPCCVPDSLFQGHAIWHLLDALSIYCLFRYYLSEDKEPDAGNVAR